MMQDNFVVLSVCTVLFALRVIGQLVVVTSKPRWLPTNEHWYSGLMPYRYLLPGQLLLLAIMVVITFQVHHDLGLFTADWWARVAPILVLVAWTYFAAMIVRYILTMLLKPNLRWFRQTIPIWFHMVLAVALWSFADYHVA